jgi:hypothetical protein
MNCSFMYGYLYSYYFDCLVSLKEEITCHLLNLQLITEEVKLVEHYQ